MNKPLLVGECNPYGADPEFALYPLPEHASGGRLARHLGLSRTEYLRAFERMNLCSGEWNMREAKITAAGILGILGILAVPPRPVVLLGTKVARAFGLTYSPLVTVGQLHMLPHPSGLNRWWNQPGNAQRARAFADRLLGRSRSVA